MEKHYRLWYYFGRIQNGSGGFVYWVQGGDFPMSMTTEKMLDLCNVLAFDVGKEEFRLIPLPRALFSAPDCCLFFHLIDLKGALGLVDCSASTDCSDTDRYDDTFKIWMMEKYDHEGEASWVKQYTIHTPGLHHSKSDNRYLFLVRTDERSYFENPDTGHEYTIKTSRLADKDDVNTQLFCYAENLRLLSSIFKEN
ncbi:F-box associated domain, type [Parasponia andersonii]|uniref:F-box associated domain, type n=1 Tax=Parasponia andersonii TaxID=3476 RepID=A0A2P5A897_PARAD|nr:F-box associated domain, type [Parasponia andersonii]